MFAKSRINKIKFMSCKFMFCVCVSGIAHLNLSLNAGSVMSVCIVCIYYIYIVYIVSSI